MVQLEKVLSKREYLVITALLQGMKPEKIAKELGISRNAVDQARFRAKQKLGEEFFSKIFAPVSDSRGHCVQNSLELMEILSLTELRVFLAMKRSQKSWELVAEEAETTPECARKLVARIKKKLGEQFDELVKTSTRIEGVEVIQIPKQKGDKPCCQNCRYFYASIAGEEGKIVFCSQHSSRLVDCSKETCSCYEGYIRVDRNSDMKKLDEALQDKNYLRMAYKIGTGYEPKTAAERMQFAVNGLGFRGYLFRRRRQARALLEGAARYPTVRLESKDRKRPEVQAILKDYCLNPVKTDFDDDGSVAYYVIKNSKAYSALMDALQAVDEDDEIRFTIAEEGTLTISCTNEIEIITISITTRTGDTQELSLDIPGMVSKEHTAEFPFGPGRYQITVHINPNAVYQYEITVIRQSGKIEITNCRPI